MDETAVVRGLPFFAGHKGGSIATVEVLSGGLQNTNYKVTVESGEAFVARIPASDAADHGQDQSIVYANAAAAAATGLAPPPVAFNEETGIIITTFVKGYTLSVELLKRDKETLLPRFVGLAKQLHESRVAFVGNTPAQDVIGGYPLEGMAALLPSGSIPPRAYELQELLRRCLGAFEPLVGCHNDLTPTNCIVSDDGTTSGGSGGAAFLIDWEWAGVYDVVHDLSKLVLLCELDEADGDEVLQLYFGANLTDMHRCRMKLWFLHTTSREALWCFAKASNPGESGMAADYDYMGEAKKYAQKFADQLALPETAELMVTLSAALAAAEAAAAAAAAPGGGV